MRRARRRQVRFQKERISEHFSDEVEAGSSSEDASSKD
jgi:hypothetical protein